MEVFSGRAAWQPGRTDLMPSNLPRATASDLRDAQGVKISTPSIRHVALLLLATALLLPPLPTHAAQNGTGTCQSLSKSGMIGDIRTVISAESSQLAPFTLRLTIHMQANGTVRGNGAIHTRSGVVAATTSATAPYAPPIIARKQTIDAACADLDGSGAAGITRLAMEVRDAATGERVPVLLSLPDNDMDASGIYAAVLQIGTETMTGAVRARLTRDRDRPHRRR